MKIPILLSVVLLAAHLFSAKLFGDELDKEISNLTAQVVSAVDQTEVKTIAALDFVDLQGNTTQLGRFLADEISTELVMTKKRFTVVDRANLKKIMQENKLTVSGLVDPGNAKKLGQIAGVDALITGTVTPFDRTVRVAVKVIATDTAKIVAAARGEIAKTASIEKLIGGDLASNDDAGRPETAESAKQPQGRVVQLGDLQVQVKSIKRLGDDLHLIATLTNTGKKPLFVFAGDMSGGFHNQNYQTLTGRASDDRGNVYEGFTVQGFTQAEDSYFNRHNLFIELGPKESGSATFTLKNRRGRYRENASTVSINIEFAMVNDLKAKGSHRTRSLVLADQKLD